MVNLRCVARSRNIEWKINETQASKPEVVRRNIRYSSELLSQNKVQSTLHILASVVNNNTVIICNTNGISTEAAILKVQGKCNVNSLLL